MVAFDNTGWPISHDPVSICESACKSFTVNQGIKGSNLAKVVFCMKDPIAVVVRCETAVNRINFDNLKWKG